LVLCAGPPVCKKEQRAGLAGRPRAKERQRFFLKKEAKTSVPKENPHDEAQRQP
jgi:hypothetical protein